MEVVAQAGDAEDLLRKVRAHKPDVAIVDIRMPPGDADDGLQAAKVIRSELPDTGVLVLSQYAGGSALDPEVVSQMVGRKEDPLQALTPREREVLELMAQGMSNKAICDPARVERARRRASHHGRPLEARDPGDRPGAPARAGGAGLPGRLVGLDQSVAHARLRDQVPRARGVELQLAADVRHVHA